MNGFDEFPLITSMKLNLFFFILVNIREMILKSGIEKE